jgi:GNAT superfamily N-acetyltransferase
MFSIQCASAAGGQSQSNSSSRDEIDQVCDDRRAPAIDSVRRLSEVQRIGPRNLPLYVQHLMRLNDDDRYRRFGCVMTDDAIRENVRKLCVARDVVLALLVNDSKGRASIVAALHLSPFVDREGRGVGELAFSVDTHYRRYGFASILLKHAFDIGKRERISRYLAMVEPSNRAMQGFARNAGMTYADDCFVWDDAEHAPLMTPKQTMSGVETLICGTEASPRALLIHGAGGASWQWRSQAIPVLASKGYTVVAPDIEAANDSDALQVSIETEARRCLQVLGGRPPVLIVAHSIGCIVAARIASIYESAQLVFANPMPADGMSERECEDSEKAIACRNAKTVFRSLANYLPSPHLRNRLTVVHGARDLISPRAYSERTLAYHPLSKADYCELDCGHLSIKSEAFSQVLAARVA